MQPTRGKIRQDTPYAMNQSVVCNLHMHNNMDTLPEYSYCKTFYFQCYDTGKWAATVPENSLILSDDFYCLPPHQHLPVLPPSRQTKQSNLPHESRTCAAFHQSVIWQLTAAQHLTQRIETRFNLFSVWFCLNSFTGRDAHNTNLTMINVLNKAHTTLHHRLHSSNQMCRFHCHRKLCNPGFQLFASLQQAARGLDAERSQPRGQIDAFTGLCCSNASLQFKRACASVLTR